MPQQLPGSYPGGDDDYHNDDDVDDDDDDESKMKPTTEPQSPALLQKVAQVL